MAYDKAVIFTCLKSYDHSKKDIFRINSCDWGWLVNDCELETHSYLGETEYKTTLTSLESIVRYEKNKKQIKEKIQSNLKYYIKHYNETKIPAYLEMLKSAKQDFETFEKCIYNKMLIDVTFEKYWFESGLN